ncbi:hypothetical protein ACTWP4_05470 [Gracilibacillus sp. D59]|uniref:hypothetical protein n=1 Tax=Gracilibacillus sp. D59 TaxID=3457434 RepID=UPI003FCC6129
MHGAKVGATTTITTNLYKMLADQLDISAVGDEPYCSRLKRHWSKMQRLIQAILDIVALKTYLAKVGGPVSFEELQLDPTVVNNSLNEAHNLRDCCTGHWLLNKYKTSYLDYADDRLPV